MVPDESLHPTTSFIMGLVLSSVPIGPIEVEIVLYSEIINKNYILFEKDQVLILYLSLLMYVDQ